MNSKMNLLIEYLPFIVPLVLLQIGLAIFSAVHVVRHPQYKFGNRMIWLLVVLLIQWIGPLVYFVFGRGDDHDRRD